MLKTTTMDTVHHALVIGAGRIGTAIGNLLAKKKIAVDFFDADPSKVPGQKPLSETVPQSNLIFLCIPSWVIREAVRDITPHLRDDTIIVLLTKGIERGTKKTVNVLLDDLLPRHKHVLISGPMLAEELLQNMSTVGVCASLNAGAAQKLKEIFSGTNLTLEHSSDVTSIALAGVLKNIYALGLGITSALNLGSNFKGWYVQQAIREMADIIGLCGGDREAAYSCAGLGDLIATGFSPHSRNRGTGERLINGEEGLQSEGTVSLESVIDLVGKKADQLPILRALGDIVLQKADAKEIFSRLTVK